MSRFFVFFFYIAIFLACNTEVEPEATNDKITIAGQIDNAGNSALRAAALVEMAKDSTNEQGNFVLRFSYHQPEYFTVRLAGQSITLFLAPGDSIFITADKDNFEETFSVSGDKADEAVYLFQKAQLESEHQLNDFRQLYVLDEMEYFEQIERAEQALATHAKALIDNENIDPLFLSLESEYSKYRFPLLHSQYTMYHRWLSSIPEEDSVLFPAAYWDEKLQELSNDQVAHLTLPVYREVISQQAQTHINVLMEQDTVLYEASLRGYLLAGLEAANQLFTNPEINEWYLFNEIYRYTDYAGPGTIDEFYDAFIASTNNEFYISNLEKARAKWEHISPGKEVPDFTFTDIDSNTVQLSDLKGKLIYLDVWATWCGPCLAEHPFWDKLYEEYSSEYVAFLTVSIDGSRTPWEKMVTEKDMKGIHWFAEGNWNSELAKHFLIQGIPRFVLIDQQGKVISASAERPSGAIREVLDANLTDI